MDSRQILSRMNSGQILMGVRKGLTQAELRFDREGCAPLKAAEEA